MQIHPGHMIFEGAKPALLDSMGMAFTAAPLFAFYEGLWFSGLRKDLHEDTLKLIHQRTEDLCKNGENMKICTTFDFS